MLIRSKQIHLFKYIGRQGKSALDENSFILYNFLDKLSPYTQSTLAGQAQKAIFKLNKYLYKFTYITPRHKLDLFDKLVSPILNYGSEVWGFAKSVTIEIVQMQFCKHILGVKRCTQNDFIYGELSNIDIFKHYKILGEVIKLLRKFIVHYGMIVIGIRIR